MSTFGDNLRKIRKEKGMTQDELAVLLGTSKQVLSRYENGQRSPKISVVADYAEKLGVSIGDLTVDHKDGNFIFFFPDEDEQTTPVGDQHPAQSPGLSDIEFALYGVTHELSENGKMDLLQFARFIHEQETKAKAAHDD